MILQWHERGLDLKFSENVVNVLVLESAEDYSKFLNDLVNALENTQDTFYLFGENKKLNLSKNVEIIFSPILLDVNNKRIQNHLYQELKQISDEVYYDLKEQTNSVVVAYLDELIKKVPYPIQFNLELDENALYKQYNVHLEFEDEDLLEKTIDYIKLTNALLGIKLFVLVNCKAYFSPEQLRELYECVLYNKIKLLMIESSETYCVPNESYYIIDKDQCLILHD